MLSKTNVATACFLALLLILPGFVSPLARAQTSPGVGFHGPWVDKLVFNFMPSIDSEILALKTGSIQLMTAPLTYDESLAINGSNNVKVSAVAVFENADFNLNLHGPNFTSTPGNYYAFNNLAFRQAWNYMMGDKSWLKQIYGPFNELDNGQLGQIYGQWYSPGTLPQQNFSKANQILDQAGFKVGSDGWRQTPNGLPIHIVMEYSNAYPQQAQWMNLLSTWARSQLSLNVDAQALTPNTLVVNGFVKHAFDMQEEEGYWISPSPEYPLDIWYNANQTVADISGFNNATFQKLDAQMEFADTTQQAIGLAHQLQTIIQQQLPGWQMGYIKIANAYRTDQFTDWVPQPGQNVWHSWWNFLNVRQVSGQPGGSLVVGSQIEPFSLNPLAPSFEDKSCAVVCLLYDSLIRLDSWNSSLALTPDLALSWDSASTTQHGAVQVWNFHLANNATWHDGAKFTSNDVKYTIQVFQKYIGNGAFSRNFQYITDVETPDNNTVSVYVNHKSIFWPYWLGLAPVLPQHIFGAQSDPSKFANSNPVGTGPFKFVSYTPGQSMVFAKNANYFHPAPQVAATSTTVSSTQTSTSIQPTTVTQSTTVTQTQSTTVVQPTTVSTTVTQSTTVTVPQPTTDVTVLAAVVVLIIVVIAVGLFLRRKRP